MTIKQNIRIADADLQPVDADTVKHFLTENPNFFLDHPDLLESITLPHASGGAVSLVERQVAMLRERNQHTQQQLQSLLDAAKINDQLFEKTKRLVLTLLDAKTLNAITEAVSHSLETDFEVQFHSLILFSNSELDINPSHTRVLPQDAATTAMGAMLEKQRTVCGVLSEDDREFLFADKGEQVGSVAAASLSNGSAFGILSLGNSDESYYRSTMGTLFLGYLSDILNRLIPPHME